MKAVVAERFGGLDALAIVERSEPVVGGRDVLIEVKAAGLNPIDFKIREGKLKLVSPCGRRSRSAATSRAWCRRPAATSPGFRVGDEVFARLEKDRMGGLAERVCCRRERGRAKAGARVVRRGGRGAARRR